MSVTEQLTAWGTLALAAVGIGQVIVTRKAVVETTADVRESTRARVDALAPRTACFPVAGLWPPHTPVDYDVTGRSPLTEETRLASPRDDKMMIYLAAVLELVNEGHSTAVVELPVDAADLGAGTDLPADSASWEQLRQVTYTRLPPGGRLGIWIRAGKTFQEWKETSSEPLRVLVAAEDTFADGIRDITTISLAAAPLVPSPEEDGRWSLNQALAGQPGRVSVRAATTRTYRGEDQRRR